MAIEETPRMHMGCDLLDLLVGGRKGVLGLPFGAILQILGDSSSGKAAPLYTKIATPKGWTAMGEIRVGDTVCTPFRGQYAKVLGVYPQGERDIYRIHFNDNTHADTADSHLWVVQTSNLYTKPTAFGRGRGAYLATTEEIARLYKGGRPAPSHLLGVPNYEPIEYEAAAELRVPPYLMGLLLADGCMSQGSTPTITNPEADVIERARRDAESVGLALRAKGEPASYSYAVVLKEGEAGRSWLPAYIRELGLDCLSIEKHIPECYLRGSVEDRTALLQGIFDGDGWVSPTGNCVITLSSKQFIADVAELGRSLGMRVTLSPSPRKASYVNSEGQRVTCQEAWDAYFVAGPSSVLPCSSAKHLSKIKKANSGGRAMHNKCRRMIRSVEYLGKMPCQCIYIDHPHHLYLMDDFIVTHNTFFKNEILASNYHRLGAEKFQWFSDDCESGDTVDSEALYGVDLRPVGRDGCLHIGKKAVDDSTTVEEMDAHVSMFLEYLESCDKGTVGAYAVDSLDGLADATREADEQTRLNQLKAGKEVKDPGSYGAELAKFLSQKFLRLKHSKLEAMQCSLIIISQIREKMNALPFQQKWSTGCGKAMEFYCHTRVFLTTIRKIEREGRVVGAYVSAKTLKSKTPRPFREVRYTVYFDYGIDNIGSNLDYLFDLRDERGQLDKERCGDIKWEPGEDFNKGTALEWLKANDWEKQCRDDRKAVEDKNQLSCEWIKKWALEPSDPEDPESTHPERIEAFESTFGKSYTRDQLVEMCDSNSDMARELTKRVVAKWESLEDAAATHRRPKYGACAPKTEEDTVAASF